MSIRMSSPRSIVQLKGQGSISRATFTSFSKPTRIRKIWNLPSAKTYTTMSGFAIRHYMNKSLLELTSLAKPRRR